MSEMLPASTVACITDVASLESGQLLCSGLNPPIDLDVGVLVQIPPEDTAKSLAVEPEKGGQEAQDQKANHLPQVPLDKAPAGVHCKKKRLPAPKVQPYFYQVNWPQEIVEKWAREKEAREKKIASGLVNCCSSLQK